jgi:hypothetical protein
MVTFTWLHLHGYIYMVTFTWLHLHGYIYMVTGFDNAAFYIMDLDKFN